MVHRGTIDVIGKMLGYIITTIGVRVRSKHLQGFGEDIYVKTGFLTFRHLASKLAACEVVLSNQGGFNLSHAPEARDILWKNVSFPRKTILWRNRVFNGALIVFALFWSSMVGLLIEFRDYLYDYNGDVLSNPFIRNLFYNYFVTVALLGIIQLLPLLFRLASHTIIKEKSLSEIERRLLSRFFSFQVSGGGG